MGALLGKPECEATRQYRLEKAFANAARREGGADSKYLVLLMMCCRPAVVAVVFLLLLKWLQLRGPGIRHHSLETTSNQACPRASHSQFQPRQHQAKLLLGM